jgi:hypothetical protein
METVFLVCAALGVTILILQVVAGSIGLGADSETDTDTDHDVSTTHGHATGGSNWFFAALSVRTAAAALAFFGLSGLTARSYGATELAQVGVALGGGAVAFYLVAFLMQSLTKLKSEGTVRIERAIGRTGSVYLRIPANRGGLGKIHLSLQNRTVELQALTTGPELPTGSPIRVVSVVNSDTVEVEASS